MLRFGSKWAYVAQDASAKEIEVEYDEDDLASDLNALADEDQAEEAAIASSSPAPTPAPTTTPTTANIPTATAAAAAAYPPPPPPTTSSNSKPSYNPLLNALKKKREAKAAAARRVTKKIRDLDTNVFSVKLGFLSEGVSMATGDLIACTCGAAFSSVDSVANSPSAFAPDNTPTPIITPPPTDNTPTPIITPPSPIITPPSPIIAPFPNFPSPQVTPCSTVCASGAPLPVPTAACSTTPAISTISATSSTSTTSTTQELEVSDQDIKYWRCSFCNKINSETLLDEEVPKEPIVDYILSVPEKIENAEDKSSVIFCIDTSSSMCVTSEIPGKVSLRGNAKSNCQSFVDDNSDQYFPGQRRDVTYVSRLQSVQAAVAAQLEMLAKQKPNSTVGLITFNDEVTVIGDGQQNSVVVAGDRLNSYDELLQAGESFSLENNIEKANASLTDKVFSLEEGGATALGPALVVSVGIAAKTPGSKVVICTDGLANVGIGSLDTDDELAKDAAERFYETIGLYAKSKGVSISVISIRGAEASLERLGILADATSGNVEMVNPLDITSQFTSILSVPVVATHVSVKLILSPYMQARDEDTEIEASSLTKEIGNVTTETEALFEYSIKQGVTIPDNLTSLPIQVQVHYTKVNGVKCVRVISEAQPVTRSREEAEAEADVSVLGVHAMKNAAVVAQKGDYSRARLYSANARHVLARAHQPHQQAEFDSYARNHSRFESTINHLQVAEQATGIYHDSDAVSSGGLFAKSRKEKRSDSSSRMLWKMKGYNQSRMESDE